MARKQQDPETRIKPGDIYLDREQSHILVYAGYNPQEKKHYFDEYPLRPRAITEKMLSSELIRLGDSPNQIEWSSGSLKRLNDVLKPNLPSSKSRT